MIYYKYLSVNKKIISYMSEGCIIKFWNRGSINIISEKQEK